MRGVRSLMLLAVAGVAAVALTACGSSSSSSPLDSSLSYFQKDSPFVLSVVTDPNASAVKSAQRTSSRIPFATFGQAALISRLQQLGINYDANIRPLFGNPFVVGISGSTAHASARARVLGAWVTKDAGVLALLIKKLHLSAAQTYKGATLYNVSTATMAVNGATLLIANSPEEVMAAIDRHTGGHGMKAADYNALLGSLPKNALITAAGNLGPLLSSPKAAKARQVPWVAALRSYGVAVTANSSGLSFQYTLDTSGGSLSPSQLPVAPGISPPGLAGTMPIQFGLREPATTLAFALDAERRTSPAKYARDVAQMNAVRRKTGVDFRRDVMAQIGNNAAIESSGHGFIARVDVHNPAAAAKTIRKLGTSALDVFGAHPGATVGPGPRGFETIHRAHGPSLLFGLVGPEFLIGSGSVSDLQTFAAAPAAAAPAAQGAAAFRIALTDLLRVALKRAPSKTIQQVLGSLGDITGWVSSTSTRLTGSATLAIK